MTIQDALERAKQLSRLRAREAAIPARGAGAAVEDAGMSARIQRPAAAPSPPIRYADLAQVELDPSECERHRILLADRLDDPSRRHAAVSYRMLRSRVLRLVQVGNWSCIGITSPGPGEGKTVTTLNLAISIAREKRRPVYVLDLDMRNPSVLAYIGGKAPQPLSSYFADSCPPEQVLCATNIENLVVAGVHEPVAGASELLAGTRLEELLAHIRQRSPDALIIIDLPPVLSSDEALVVGPRADAIFLVVSEGMTRRDALVRSLDHLHDFNVAGVILNRSRVNTGAEGYQYGYGDRYGSGGKES
jgi:protein-tyrosine kinase